MRKKRQQYSSEHSKRSGCLGGGPGRMRLCPILATRYGLHPTQVNAWKRQLTSQASELFARGKGSWSTSDAQVEELYRVIGQLTVEKDFLAGRLGH